MQGVVRLLEAKNFTEYSARVKHKKKAVTVLCNFKE